MASVGREQQFVIRQTLYVLINEVMETTTKKVEVYHAVIMLRWSNDTDGAIDAWKWTYKAISVSY